MALFPMLNHDSSVIDRILRGARDDFEILVRRYHASVYALAYSRLGNVADAEDATQESFLKAFRNLATIRDKKKFGAWLMTVARNESTRIGRKKSTRPPLDEPSPEIPDMAQRELHQILRQQIHTLDTPHRDVLLLHYFSGLKVREIAALLQISKAAAGKRLERARATLGEQVVAQLGAGLEEEGPNQKGEKRVMAAVVAAPIPSRATAAAAGGTRLLRYAAFTGILGAAILALLIISPPPQQSEAQPEPVGVGLSTVDSSIETPIQFPTVLAKVSPQEAASVDGDEAAKKTAAAGTEENGGVIEGHIFDAKTGESLAGARVSYRWFLVDRARRIFSSTIADSDGRFKFEDLEPGRYTFELNDYDQEKARQTATITERESISLEFPVNLGGTFIAGRIVDEDGEPVSGAHVQAMTNQENRVRKAESGEDGRYRVGDFLGPGTGFKISVQRPDFAFERLLGLTVPEGGLTGLDFILEPESTVSGKVVDEQGNPLGDVGLRPMSVEGNGFNGLDFMGPRSESDGTFTISNLSEGAYAIVATNPGGHSYSRSNEIAQVEVGRSEHIEGLVLVSPYPLGLSISGRVVDTLGRPIAYGTVSARSDEAGRHLASADLDGSYIISGLSEGAYQLNASDAKGTRGQSIDDVEAGSSGIDFVFDVLATLRGVVIEASSGAPIPSFEMTYSKGLRSEIDHHAMWQLKNHNSQQGEFELTELPTGDITLFVRAQGFAHEFIHVSGIQAAEEREGIRIALSEGVAINGRVLDPDGAPVSGALVYLGPLPDQQFLSHSVAATADGLGEFTVSVPNGASQTLTAHDTRFASTTVEVRLSSDRINNVEIALGKTGIVTGFATFDGVPLAAASISVMQGETHLGSFRTDADGAFRLENLPTGLVTLRALAGRLDRISAGGAYGFTYVEGTPTVAEDQETGLQLDGFSGTAAIEGVLEWAGTRGQNLRITLHAYVPIGANSEVHVQQYSIRNGDRYRFDNLPEGPVRIEIQGMDPITQESHYAYQETTLRTGETVELDLLVTE